MDIRKWLAETENPISSEQPEVDRFPLPRQPDTAPDARRRRKRSSSDSSLLKAASPQPRRKGFTAKKLDRCEVPDVVNEDHSDISRSTSGGSTGSIAASQRYARKSRRKTRADKYNVGSKNAKTQDEGQRPSRRSDSRKSKRKSRRRKDEKNHNGIGREFQARNVAKERLTLKPSEKIGLFSKGRTSTSVRGRGLPDLVFSKMKFLRNNDEGKDHTTQAPDAQKKRKKDHARTIEEDISTFFTTARPALEDTDANAQAKSRRPTGVSAGSIADRRTQTRDPSRAPGTAVPVIESEGKASYLGFGSQGPEHESNSSFSCPESMRAPSVTPGKPMDASIDRDKCVGARSRDIEQVPSGRSTADHHKMPSPFVDDRVTATSTRFQASSLAPVPSGMSRSQSLPHPSSPPRRPNLVNRAFNRHAHKDVTSPPSMSPVLQGSPHAGRQEDPMTEGSIRTSYVSESTKSMRRRTSTDALRIHSAHGRPPRLVELGRMLRHAEETSAASQFVPTRQDRRTEAQPPAIPFDTDRRSRRNVSRRTVEAPAVRFAVPDFHPSRLPNFYGPSIYVQQEQRQLLQVSLGFGDDGGYNCPDGDGCGQEYISDAGILDHEDFEALPDEQVPCGLMEELDDDVEGLDYVADGEQQVQELEHTSVVRPGFWRPNRLY